MILDKEYGTTKAVQLLGKEKLRIGEVPVPKIGEGEALLKVRAASICGTDVRMYKNGHPGVSEERPLILGHEFSGDIVQVGKNVTSLKPGKGEKVMEELPSHHQMIISGRMQAGIAQIAKVFGWTCEVIE